MATVDNYDEIGWEDAPEHKTTPTDARNLNHMDGGIKGNNTAIKALIQEMATKADNAPTFTEAASRANISSGEAMETILGKIKKYFSDLGNLAFKSTDGSSKFLRGDGTWATPANTTYSNGTGLNLSSNTFSVKYGTAAGTACQGNDSRLSNARPASDVYSWAKQSSKPSYSWNEITGKPSQYPPENHTHSQYVTSNGATFLNTMYLMNGGHFWLYNYGNSKYSNIWTADNGTLSLGSAADWLNLRAPYIQCRNGADTGWTSCLAAAFNVQSSRRYKENIEDITEEEAKKILDVRVVNYDYKDGVVSETRHQMNQHGVIAEEVDEIIPEVVNYAIPYGQEAEFKEPVPDGVDYAKFVPYLIKMVQMQQNKIEELERR